MKNASHAILNTCTDNKPTPKSFQNYIVNISPVLQRLCISSAAYSPSFHKV